MCLQIPVVNTRRLCAKHWEITRETMIFVDARGFSCATASLKAHPTRSRNITPGATHSIFIKRILTPPNAKNSIKHAIAKTETRTFDYETYGAMDEDKLV